MSRMSEPAPLAATLSVEELRAALGRQRAVNTELRTVLASQVELYQAALAARDARIAALGSQVVVLGDQVAHPYPKIGGAPGTWRGCWDGLGGVPVAAEEAPQVFEVPTPPPRPVVA